MRPGRSAAASGLPCCGPRRPGQWPPPSCSPGQAAGPNDEGLLATRGSWRRQRYDEAGGPLLADPLPPVAVLVDPVFAVFALPEAVSAGLLLVPPEPAGLDGGEAGGEELVLAGAGEDALTLLGPAVLDGGVVVGGQGV